MCAFQVKATEQYFHAILFITLYKVVLTFKSIDGIPRCDHEEKNYLAVFSVIDRVLFTMAFGPVNEVLKCDHRDKNCVCLVSSVVRALVL